MMPHLDYATDFLATHRDTTLSVPMNPLAYFVSGRRNSSRFHLPIPANISEDDKKEFLHDLVSASYVIFDDYWPFDGRPFSVYQPEMNRLLNEDFHVVAKGPAPLVVLERNSRL